MKETWKPGNMLYPLPAVMVSVTDGQGNDNIITVGWTGTICTNPPMVYISVRPSRYSYEMLKKTGEFVINLTTEEFHLTKEPAQFVKAPMIKESPVSIECRVTEVKELGSHHMFLAEVLAVHAQQEYIDKNNKFQLNKAKPIVYSHGEYLGTGKSLGTFGYSVKKRKKQEKR